MKILYTGGQKSGKSRLAEQKAVELASPGLPYYIATYDNSYRDEEMAERLRVHRQRRSNRFIDTIEEPHNFSEVIIPGNTYLVDCVSMWILNTLSTDLKLLEAQIESAAATQANIVFVINNVGAGIIPPDTETRLFVDRTGVLGQKIASLCDEVYEVVFGLSGRLK